MIIEDLRNRMITIGHALLTQHQSGNTYHTEAIETIAQEVRAYIQATMDEINTNCRFRQFRPVTIPGVGYY
jgi:hypothetical protein